MDLSRIATNTQSQQAYSALSRTNNELGVRQLRLATGSRINRAEDDSAGYTIANKLESKVRGQAQALANIGDAKSLLSVGEGSLGSVMDILQSMKEKSVQAANDTMGTAERTAIGNELTAMQSEVDDILSKTEFNGTSLFTSSNKTLNFQVGAEDGDAFSFTFNALTSTSLLGSEVTTGDQTVNGNAYDADSWTGSQATIKYKGNDATAGSLLGMEYDETNDQMDFEIEKTDGSVITGSVAFDAATYGGEEIDIAGEWSVKFGANGGGGYTFGDGEQLGATTAAATMSVSSHANASASIAKLDTAVSTISQRMASIGDAQKRLSFKSENLQTSMTNYDSARSRIADADFAKEQMNIVKLQILQQTGTAGLAQANAGPQSVLSLLG